MSASQHRARTARALRPPALTLLREEGAGSRVGSDVSRLRFEHARLAASIPLSAGVGKDSTPVPPLSAGVELLALLVTASPSNRPASGGP